jgi:hypothetical protein
MSLEKTPNTEELGLELSDKKRAIRLYGIAFRKSATNITNPTAVYKQRG